MSFAADLKDFTAGFATGWKLATPTAAEVRAAEDRQGIKEREEFRRLASGTGTRRAGGGPDEDTTIPTPDKPATPDTSTTANVAGSTTDPAAEDLQPHEKALLNAIAGPESAGRYNVRYTPGGGTTFDETGEHPGIYEPTKEGKKSSAAGRYQFVKSTWDRIAGKDVPFTRENQDRMALKLARQDYKARTGRDLDEELKTNGLTPGIMRQLSPTWAGFGGAGGRSKAANIYQASLNRYSGDTSTKAGLPRYTGPEEDRSETVQTDEEAPATRTASAVPLPPVRPASLTAPETGAIPVRRVRTTPASAVTVDEPSRVIDAATGRPIPPDDPRLQTPTLDRVHGRSSALDIYPGVTFDEFGNPIRQRAQFAAEGGLVDDTSDEVSQAADMQYLYGDGRDSYASGRSGYGAKELIDGGSIPKMISSGMDFLTKQFGLTSGAIPDQSPRAQQGVQAFAAGAGTPSSEEVDQIMQTVDPHGQLPKEQRHVVGWGNLYHYFSDRGDAQGAARAAGAMLMYSKNVSRQAGVIALAALEKGDFKRASDAVAAAYDYLPDGKALKVKDVGPGGVEYETVDVDGKRVDKGKITRQELGEIAKGMVDGTVWFQSVNAASQPIDKKARRDVQTAKNVDRFLELAGDATSVDELSPEARKSYSALSASEKRAWQAERRTEAKTRKTESEAEAEAEFSESPELRDQFLSSMSEKDRAAYGRMSNAGKARAVAAGVRALKERKAEGESKAEADYLTGDAEDDFINSRTEAQREAYNKMGDKGKARALASFKDDRRQAFNEFKFDERMGAQQETRDRAEALKLFGMSQRYGMWQKTREQVMTENERRAADRLMQEEGRNQRQDKSIAQQNKVQDNIDRRILEKRTATQDGAGQRLTAPEAREKRRLGGIDAEEEARLQALDEGVITAGPEATPEEQASARERMARPIRAGAGFRRLGKDQVQEMTDDNRAAIAARLDENLKEQKNPGVKEWASRIAQDVYRSDPQRTEQQAADIVTQSIFHPQEPKVFPGGLVQLVPGLPPVRMSEESMAALVTQRELAKRGAAKKPGAAATATGDEFQSPAAKRIAAERAATSQRGEASRTALNLEAAARERPGGDIYEGLRAQLGPDWQEGMSLPQMRQALQDLENERAYGGKRARVRRQFESTRSAVDLLPQR